MGFLSDSSKGPSIYTEITETSKLVRPLASKPATIWCHKINQVTRTGPDGKLEVVRPFAYEVCTSTGRNGIGCYLCTTPDPLWHMLSDEEKHNKNGKRVDFGKAPLHHLPVHEHATKATTVIRSGNMLFKPMDEWYDTQQGSNQDLRRCDWAISKSGSKKRTQYTTSRMDVSAFPITTELEESAKQVMIQAMNDKRPTAADVLAKMIHGLAVDNSVGLPQAAPVPQLPAPVAVQTPAVQPEVAASTWTTPPVSVPQSMPQTVSVAQPQSIVAAPGTTASKSSVEQFGSWIAQQPEFSGLGMVTTFIPAIKEAIGHVEYHRLSEQQLAEVKAKLEAKLIALRAK